jgi:hypothetical protein
LGVAFHSFRNENAAQALKHAPTTPAEIVEAIGHKRGFTVETYLTVWLAGAAAGGPQSGTVPGRQKRRVRTVSAFTLSVEASIRGAANYESGGQEFESLRARQFSALPV